MSQEMDKIYNPKESEEKIYQMWEGKGYFTPKIEKGKKPFGKDQGKPFTVLLPPPNANDPLHMGHALFVVEDILCRWHRMKSEPVLFLPGTDHAGIETQYVFEKRLKEQGKSRFDFDRDTLYRMINDFVEQNRGVAKIQMKKLGFGLDWTRERYTLEPAILETVFATFRKLHEDGLIYRNDGIVNYCTYCGTAFSELEVEHIEKDDFLYFLDYGAISIATTRPETIFADTAVAVNPKDKRYKNLIGKTAFMPITNKELLIIADDLVDMEFGAGALKITPAHDSADFEIGKKHELEPVKIIDTNGKMINVPEKYLGLYAKQARQAVLGDLKAAGKLTKTEPLRHSVGICYRCKNIIEPLAMPQWFIKIAPLAKPALEAVKKEKIKIIPKRFEKLYLQWMENIRDWNISRQIVWGPRIPAWYCLSCNPDIVVSFVSEKGEKVFGKYQDIKKQYDFAEIKKGLQSLTAPKDAVFFLDETPCEKCKSTDILQETDTFDTWFSSGQWPFTTLLASRGSNSKFKMQSSKLRNNLDYTTEDFEYFYPTSVLDTMWDILFFWVARMIMLCIYVTGKIPFEVAHMHCRVVDKKGQKMSKSRGNVINPIEMVDKYGADALRMALVFSSAPGSDVCLGEENFLAMRKFTNKIWNAARFVLSAAEQNGNHKLQTINYKLAPQTEADKQILKTLDETVKEITKDLENFYFHEAAQKIYHFFWHTFCDIYIEQAKKQIAEGDSRQKENTCQILLYVLRESMKLLHPFMPFITEQIYQMLPNKDAEALIIAPWPRV
ncbi:MAG: valine--tRNA ligase [Patescibacteria group bacterium]|nr:valine--tRNA ligase [Patescibacteria group bacterium]